VLVATLSLFVFYYFLRADWIGVRSPAGGWYAMTRSPLPVPLHFLASGLVLGILPLLLARGLTGRSLAGLGLGRGNPRRSLLLVAVGLPLAVLAGRIASGSPDMQAVYPLESSLPPQVPRFVIYSLIQLAYYFGWEVLFRGVLLFGTKDRLGFWGANVLQTALSVVAHFGRPLEETFSAYPAGLLFGAVAVRTGSVWPLVLVHWVVGMSMNAFMVFGGRA